MNRYALEPLSIIVSFTLGTLWNRRRDLTYFYTLASRAESGHGSGPNRTAEKPTNTFWSLLGRFWNKFPFLIEIWYWNLTYWIYQLLRALSARLIAGHKPIFDVATAHALAILRLETCLGLAIEQRFQHYILTAHPHLMPLLAKIYYSHITVGVVFLVYMFKYAPTPAIYQRIRRTLATNNSLAFIFITLWRCTPPRLLPKHHGFLDVLHVPAAGGSTANVWNNNRFQLTIAAMPSLHFGTALFLAVCLVRFSPHRIVRLLAPLWPAAMLVTILATANHFVLDAVVGGCIPYFGWKLNTVWLRFYPAQEFVFGPMARRMPKAD